MQTITIICPMCDTEAIISDNGIHAICANPNCKSKKLIPMQNMFNIFDIDFISDKIIEKLFYNGYNTYSKIENISEDEFCIIVGFGKSNFKTLKNGLQNLKLSKEQVLQCCMIKGISGTQSKKLIAEFKGIKSLIDWLLIPTNNVLHVEGFGEKLNKELKENIYLIRDMYNQLKHKIYIEESDNVITKGEVCCTGKCEKYGRKELKKIVEDMGYVFSTSVKKDTCMLIVDNVNSTSSKMTKAKKQGTKIQTYEQFLEV